MAPIEGNNPLRATPTQTNPRTSEVGGVATAQTPSAARIGGQENIQAHIAGYEVRGIAPSVPRRLARGIGRIAGNILAALRRATSQTDVLRVTPESSPAERKAALLLNPLARSRARPETFLRNLGQAALKQGLWLETPELDRTLRATLSSQDVPYVQLRRMERRLFSPTMDALSRSLTQRALRNRRADVAAMQADCRGEAAAQSQERLAALRQAVRDEVKARGLVPMELQGAPPGRRTVARLTKAVLDGSEKGAVTVGSRKITQEKLAGVWGEKKIMDGLSFQDAFDPVKFTDGSDSILDRTFWVDAKRNPVQLVDTWTDDENARVDDLVTPEIKSAHKTASNKRDTFIQLVQQRLLEFAGNDPEMASKISIFCNQNYLSALFEATGSFKSGFGPSAETDMARYNLLDAPAQERLADGRMQNIIPTLIGDVRSTASDSAAAAGRWGDGPSFAVRRERDGSCTVRLQHRLRPLMATSRAGVQHRLDSERSLLEEHYEINIPRQGDARIVGGNVSWRIFAREDGAEEEP